MGVLRPTSERRRRAIAIDDRAARAAPSSNDATSASSTTRRWRERRVPRRHHRDRCYYYSSSRRGIRPSHRSKMITSSTTTTNSSSSTSTSHIAIDCVLSEGRGATNANATTMAAAASWRRAVEDCIRRYIVAINRVVDVDVGMISSLWAGRAEMTGWCARQKEEGSSRGKKIAHTGVCPSQIARKAGRDAEYNRILSVTHHLHGFLGGR